MTDSHADELIEVRGVEEVRALLGPLDSNTRLIRELHGVNVLVRDGGIRLLGQERDVARVRALLDAELADHRRGVPVVTSEVAERLRRAAPTAAAVQGDAAARDGGSLGDLDVPFKATGPVKPKTKGQRTYWQAMREHEVVFGIGPAGTGKTYLAVAAAVEAVKSGAVRRIVLARPAVEAGEKLGFLPGDLQAKVDPYVRPLYDALHDLLDPIARQRYLESGVIEVCPLAYMRGRTLNDAFVILDEAQNTTVPQMMMFLTRMGNDSRVVVTGDPSQVDLPRDVRSGLADAVQRLGDVEGVHIAKLTPADIVRHPVVQRILAAYEKSKKSPPRANGD